MEKHFRRPPPPTPPGPPPPRPRCGGWCLELNCRPPPVVGTGDHTWFRCGPRARPKNLSCKISTFCWAHTYNGKCPFHAIPLGPKIDQAGSMRQWVVGEIIPSIHPLHRQSTSCTRHRGILQFCRRTTNSSRRRELRCVLRQFCWCRGEFICLGASGPVLDSPGGFVCGVSFDQAGVCHARNKARLSVII